MTSQGPPLILAPEPYIRGPKEQKLCPLQNCHPALYVVHRRAKPVLNGPISTKLEPNLFNHGETTDIGG